MTTPFSPGEIARDVTPGRIRDYHFNDARRGYDKGEVRGALLRIATEVARLHAVVAAEREEARRCRDALTQWQSEHAQTCVQPFDVPQPSTFSRLGYHDELSPVRPRPGWDTWQTPISDTQPS